NGTAATPPLSTPTLEWLFISHRILQEMKKLRMTLVSFVSIIVIGSISLFVAANSTLFFGTRLDRALEDGLPRVLIEDAQVVYCRMKADDFRFELPNGGVAADPLISSGGFDTVKGSVEISFPQGDGISADEYESWMQGRLQVGGWISARDDVSTGNLIVDFSYFGDK
ncbi:MAG: hypothetical protein ACSHX7_14470, partial [Luteolibacter sp.]